MNRQEDANGNQTAAGRSFNYAYNNVDQVITQTDDWSLGTPMEQLSYAYTPTGLLQSRLLSRMVTGIWTPEQEADFTYFDNGLTKQQTNYSGSAQSGTIIEQHTLSYLDGSGDYQNGNQASDSFKLLGPDTSAPCRTSTCTASWSYDANDRVIYDNTGTRARPTWPSTRPETSPARWRVGRPPLAPTPARSSLARQPPAA